MTIFTKYARVYDLLYKDKNYPEEVNFVFGLLGRFRQETRSILDLGCGTGRHAKEMARMGLQVVAFDRSLANVRCVADRFNQSDGRSGRLNYFVGDLTAFALSRKFDAIVSLFHVFSYLTKTNQLIQTLRNSRNVQSRTGLLVFDCWYGPAVLTLKPEVRVKTVETDRVKVIRVCEPTLRPNDNVVDVNFTLHVIDKVKSTVERFSEVHSMRYLFKPEVEHILSLSGYSLLHASEWMTDLPLTETSWNATFIARAI